tara:strand:- start:7553 stop:8137 length:585 start_codon:yes stop_codon:yes gene_type:complete
MDKNISKHETRWDGSISYGNTIFIGDLIKTSTTKYLPNVALAIKFNKEYNPETSLQLSIIKGNNSGEKASTYPNIPSINFRSQYTQGYIAYRKAITPTGIQIPQLHLHAGIGFYYADASRTTTLNGAIAELSDEISSLVFPLGLELSYYIKEEWGMVLGVSNNIFSSDNIDLHETTIDLDQQLIINLGICYSFN